MSDWKDLFQEHILARGEAYYFDGAVLELHKTEHGYHAVVEGTEDYEVDIEMEGGRVCEMYCSCPYAEDGNNCKHMAAVLFEIEEQNEEDILTEETCPDDQEQEVEEIIERIPEEELRSFVKGIAAQDSEIRNTLMTRYAVKIDEKQMNLLKQGVGQLVWEYGDRSGYIDYRNALDFCWALENYLEEKGNTLIERKCYGQAFELTNYVFKTIGNIDIDDSDGGTAQVANACYDKWKEILENCSEEEKNEMFSWFMSHLSCDYVVDYMEDYMEDFLTHEFQNREMLEKMLKDLDKKIEMHWRFSAVRELEIQENLDNGNLGEAIRILQESKILDKEYPGLIARYSEQLISIYETQTDKEAYKKELLYYVFECPQNNLVHIYKLKEVCTDKEWEDYREQILKRPKNYNILYPFMEKEGMYERMIECIKKETFIYNLDRYEKVLKDKFPEQVRDIYISYLHHEAERAGNRKRYRELIKYLKKIRRYPGGKEKASEIAENWRGMYYRRTAMMDEMRKAGF